MSEETKPPEGQSPDVADTAKAHIEKILKEKKNFAEALEKERAEKLQIQEQLKAKELNEAKLKGDIEGIVKIKDNELNEWKAKAESLMQKQNEFEQSKTKEYKLASLKKELVKMGAADDTMEGLLRLSNLDLIKWEDEHKVALGAEDEAKRIKSMMPVAFGVQTPRTDHSAPGSPAANIDIEAYKKLSLKEQRDPAIIARVMQSAGITAKK